MMLYATGAGNFTGVGSSTACPDRASAGALADLLDLLLELGRAFEPAAGNRLVLTVRRRRPASRWSGFRTGIATIVVQLGLATMPFGMQGVGVHLGDDERYLGIHAPGRRIVDDRGARSATRSASSSRVVLPAENSATSAGVVGGGGVLDFDLTIAPGRLATR